MSVKVKAMLCFLRDLRLRVKVFLLGMGGVLITAVALVALAVWQSGQYHAIARNEADALMNADLDHIALGVYNLVRVEDEAAQQQVGSNLNVARRVLANLGGVSLANEPVTWTAVNQFNNATTEVRLPRMMVGGRWLGQNSHPEVETLVVDEVATLVGETVTIFQRMNEQGDMLRVATTVMTAEGKRAIGTYVPAIAPDGTPSPVIAAVLRGERFRGRAYVVNTWYLTAYEPIKDAEDRLVGMLYVGVQQKVVEARIRNAVLQTRVGRTGYVYVLSGKGEDRGRYVISQDGERDGENIWESRDSDGGYVVQAIINKATGLRPGELATQRYRWQNPGEPQPRWKTARLAYYAPWDWVIGVSAYDDELQRDQAILTAGRSRMISTMVLAGLAITFSIGLASAFLAWTIARPVGEMTRVAERIAQGDLTQTVEVRSRDEIGTLAETLNAMANRLKDTMAGLRRSEERHRLIVENAVEGIFLTSFEGRVLSANPAFARMLGYDSVEEVLAELTDLRHRLHVRPEDGDAFIAEVRERGVVLEREIEYRRKDRATIWVSFNAKTVCDDAGRPLFVQGFVTDITERRLREECIRGLNAVREDLLKPAPLATKLQRITDAAVAAFRADFARIWIVGPGDRCEAGCLHACGTEGAHACPHRDRCLHLTASSGRYTHLDGEKHRRVPLGSYKIGRIATGEEDRFLTNDVVHDSRIHDPTWAAQLGLVAFAGYRLTSSEGAPVGVLALFSRHEISADEDALLQTLAGTASQVIQTSIAEDAVVESEQKLRGILHGSPIPAFVIDKDHRVIHWNRALEELSGIRPEDVLNTREHWRAFYDHRRPCLCDLLVDGQTEAIASWYPGIRRKCDWAPEAYEATEFFANIGDGGRWLHFAAAAIRDSRGNLMGAVETFQDITVRKQAEEALRRKNEELEQFAYTASHDLKSPLVTIRGFLAKLRQDLDAGDAERIHRDMHFVENAAKKMESLLDELLELSRIGRKVNPPEDASLQDLAREAIELVAGRIAERGVSVRVTDTPYVLHGDRPRLREVFQNLIDNAVKFMGDQPAPQVEIGVEERNGAPVLFVRDNGMGIDPRHQQRLFGLFEKLNPEIEGTGMGLAIVKRIVELHGGRIWLESAGPGQGTTFFFTLAKTRPESAPAPAMAMAGK